MPSIKDVAKYLNLSITTVSRALDGYSDVSETTRKRVIKAAKELGYVPSRAARQLRRQKSEAIGYIIPTAKPSFSDPFFSKFIAGLGDATSSFNYDLLISVAPPNSEIERSVYRRWVQSRRVDGIVLTRMRIEDWRVRFLLDEKFPLVSFGRTHTSDKYPHIGVDGNDGIQKLIAHLVEQGHRKIGYISAPADLTLQLDRSEGYKSGLLKAGLPYEENLIVEGDLTKEGGRAAAAQLLTLLDPPTAIVCANDLTAIGVLGLAQEKGIEVGKRLAIAGFDGIDTAEHTSPKLTTLSQPVYECAKKLVGMLVALINNENGDSEDNFLMISPDLIIRDSTQRW